MRRQILGIAALSLALLPALAGCGGSSPTSPNPVPQPTQPFSLTIQTRAAAPAHTEIPGAHFPYVHVAAIDTPSNEWRGQWLTQDETSVRFENLVGTAHVRVGDVPAGSERIVEPITTTVLMDGDKVIELLLKPLREQRSLPLDPTRTGFCGDGWSTRQACRAYMLPIYHDGPVSAAVTWDSGLSDLSMELWREDQTRLAVSVSTGQGQQQIPPTNVTGGHTYYLRILFDDRLLLYAGTINATS